MSVVLVTAHTFWTWRLTRPSVHFKFKLVFTHWENPIHMRSTHALLLPFSVSEIQCPTSTFWRHWFGCHAVRGLLECFHKPQNSDMHCRICLCIMSLMLFLNGFQLTIWLTDDLTWSRSLIRCRLIFLYDFCLLHLMDSFVFSVITMRQLMVLQICFPAQTVHSRPWYNRTAGSLIGHKTPT